MSKVIKLRQLTPRGVLEDALEKVESFESVVLVGYTKEGRTTVGFSNQTNAELAYSSVAYQKFILEFMEEV